MGKKITIDFSKATEEKPIEKTSQKKAEKPHKYSDGRQKREFTAEQVVSRQYRKCDIYTHDGHQLNIREAKFIDTYLATGNQRQAVIEAGYNYQKDNEFAGQIAQKILSRNYIKSEIDYRIEAHKSKGIADRQEIMQFFSDMMRGKILDQFDLPANNSDKIKAGVELAKRCIDIEDRIKEKTTQTAAPEIKISLAWEGRNGEKK